MLKRHHSDSTRLLPNFMESNMAIQIGDTLPNVNLYELSDQGPVALCTESLFSDKKVVIFALPGAFTPTCSAAHVPGFVVNADKIKALGVDEIICVSVNDAWVMGAWGKQQNATALRMLGDGSADFTEAVDLVKDLTGAGMGVRSQRYALIAVDGVVTWIGVDATGLDQSSAESVMAQL